MVARKVFVVVRVAAYVDGFNLYHGLKQKYGRKYLWLDLQALADRLLRPGQTLVKVKYFTARVRNSDAAEQRQSAYLDALVSHSPLVSVVNGRFQLKRVQCRHCATAWNSYEEKETDVSIAVTLLKDAVQNQFDTALLVSADSDLCPAVQAVRDVTPNKRIIGVSPPARRSGDLARATHGHVAIGTDKIRQSQLPSAVTTSAGNVLRRPKYWA